MVFGPIVAYNVDKIIDIIMESMEIDENTLDSDSDEESNKYIDALEHFEYNIDGAWVGNFTPLHLSDNKEFEE